MSCLPYFCTGEIVKGFGRGSKELGCPTGNNFVLFIVECWNFFSNFIFQCILFNLANIPMDVVKKLPEELKTGIYFGWANVDNGDVYKAVLSIGWNPFYDNKEKSLVCTYFIHYLFT